MNLKDQINQEYVASEAFNAVNVGSFVFNHRLNKLGFIKRKGERVIEVEYESGELSMTFQFSSFRKSHSPIN